MKHVQPELNIIHFEIHFEIEYFVYSILSSLLIRTETFFPLEFNKWSLSVLTGTDAISIHFISFFFFPSLSLSVCVCVSVCPIEFFFYFFFFSEQ